MLSKSHQSLITRYIRQKLPPWIILCDVEPIPNLNGSLENISSDHTAGVNRNISNAAEKSNMSPIIAEAVGNCADEFPNKQKESHGGISHLIYLRHLQNNQPARSTIEIYGSGYQDYLQAPLQPLADNLESVTYEVFEKDPVKYDWYERAIVMALSDWSKHSKPTSSPNGAVVIAVAGSGRGPLVTRALRASKITGVTIELWAVEKNPNAFVLLQRHNEEEWGGVVNVVKSDMRAWKGPLRHTTYLPKESDFSRDSSLNSSYGRVDIIISELLGSFADNELSPECLDGVQHVLATDHGISIPSSYTAHLTPILAPRLYAEISHRAISDDTATETPYVVLLNAIDFLASSVPDHPCIQRAWGFTHPLLQSTLAISTARRSGGVSGGGGGSMSGGDGANEHNARATKLKFICKDRGVMHGIAGYFEAVLYDGGESGKVELSTRPDTMDAKSKDMISWFPIYFPLKVCYTFCSQDCFPALKILQNPLYFPDDSELEVSMWRQTDDRKVWYEWLVEAFVMIGPASRIRLGTSDMGSSRKVGCLM